MNVTETIIADDDFSETADGTTTETRDEEATVDDRDSETLSGTMSIVDPTTGVTTSIAANDTFTDTLHDQETDGDTSVKPPSTSSNSTPTDTPTTTEGGTNTARLQINETVTETNPDSTPVSTNSTLPQSVHADITDTETSTNGVETDAVTFVDSTGDNAPTFSSGPVDFTVPIGSTPTGLTIAATGNSSDSVTYSISGANVATIDPTTGALTFTGPIATCSEFSVTATDTVTGSSTTESVHINAVDASLLSSCFAPGTPIRIPGGFKKIEEIQAGDYVLARDEHRPDRPAVARRVELVFHADGQLCELTISGRTIRTTPEHRFHLYGGDWVAAKELQPGSQLTSLDGPPLIVEAITSTPILTRVHNMRVAEDHTYFVGEDNWGWSVWAHNECDPSGASPFGANRTTWQWAQQAISDTLSTETLSDMAAIGPSWLSDYFFPDLGAATMVVSAPARVAAGVVFVGDVSLQEAKYLDDSINGRPTAEVPIDLSRAAKTAISSAPLGPLANRFPLVGDGLAGLMVMGGGTTAIQNLQNEDYVQSAVNLTFAGMGAYSLGTRALPTNPSKNSQKFQNYSEELINSVNESSAAIRVRPEIEGEFIPLSEFEAAAAQFGKSIPASRPSASTKVIETPETIAPKPVKPSEVGKRWEDFLGPGEPTNVHPRTGGVDADRLVSPDGSRSIRYGSHEMNSKPTKHHYHEETWAYDPVTDTMTYGNTIIRVPLIR